MSQLRVNNRNHQESARHGSRTITITENYSEFENSNSNNSDNDAPSPVGRIHLTGDSDNSDSRRIRWDENVIDNEGMGKKKSKICCIYHKPRPVGESDSDETDSDDSSDEQTYRGKNIGSPNAYEKAPKYKSKSCHDNCHNSH